MEFILIQTKFAYKGPLLNYAMHICTHIAFITIFNWSDKVHVESCNYFLDKTKIGKLTVFFMRSTLANHRQGQ